MVLLVPGWYFFCSYSASNSETGKETLVAQLLLNYTHNTTPWKLQISFRCNVKVVEAISMLQFLFVEFCTEFIGPMARGTSLQYNSRTCAKLRSEFMRVEMLW